MSPSYIAFLATLVTSLVGVVRSSTRLPDGSQRITGAWVLLVALVALAAVYLGARYLPEDVFALVSAYIAATGGTAVLVDVAKAAAPKSDPPSNTTFIGMGDRP